jgi:predicted NBD/HSP70 family sugar kinase
MHSQLHPSFCAADDWLRRYECEVEKARPDAEPLTITVLDANGRGSSVTIPILPRKGTTHDALTIQRVERLVKTLLWQRGGCEVWLDGHPDLLDTLKRIYSKDGTRAFDYAFFAERIYQRELLFLMGKPDFLPNPGVCVPAVGAPAPGCRIGYDLGGSDRKCAAVIDGEVVFSEEVKWNPYHQSDPSYHMEGVRDSLRRAAAHLPRVDAIGGSSAGVILDHVPQVSSLFRGLSEQAMSAHIRPFFRNLSMEWGGIPVTLLNDGEVTALAGAKWLGTSGVLGIAMGTSLAAGYVDATGQVGSYLNELAFCPVDYGESAPLDEWSRDRGCGVQYFSQQAVFRLADESGMDVPENLDASEKLRWVQRLADQGDARALAIFRRVGQYLGHTVPLWRRFYDFSHLLLLGRVVSGVAGSCMVEEVQRVMDHHPALQENPVFLHVPDETFKRHGQAIVAASVPQLNLTSV